MQMMTDAIKGYKCSPISSYFSTIETTCAI